MFKFIKLLIYCHFYLLVMTAVKTLPHRYRISLEDGISTKMLAGLLLSRKTVTQCFTITMYIANMMLRQVKKLLMAATNTVTSL